MNSFSQGLYITREHWSLMVADIKSRRTEEACGIILGEGNVAALVVPVTNLLHSPTRFRMEPSEQLDAFLLAEKKNLEVLAVYHSHPNGIATPSATDLTELTFPGLVYLIWYENETDWKCRGFLMITTHKTEEVSVIITP